MQQRLIRQRLAGKIDGKGFIGIVIPVLTHPFKKMLYHPDIDLRHQQITLSRRHEGSGRYRPTILIQHTQQDFIMNRAVNISGYGDNRLIVEFKQVVIQCVLNTHHPLHLTAPQ